MAASARSMKSLWLLLTNSVGLRSEDGAELEKYGRQLVQGITFYKKPSAASSQRLHQEKLSPEFVEFIVKISQFLDLDEMQSLELLTSYLTNEFKGSEASFKVGLKSDKFVQQSISQIWIYYHSERMRSLGSLKHILSHWQDKSHPNQDLYEGFMEMFSKHGLLCTSLITQLQTETMTTASKTSSLPELIDGKRWALNCLQEQSELLQCLLLYFKDLECSPQNFQSLLNIIQTHSFGRRQASRQYFDQRCQELQKTISHLEGLLLVENLELDWLFEAQDGGSVSGYTLQQDHKTWKDIESQMDALGSAREHSPAMLAWVLVRHLLASPCPDQYGACAVRHGVFEYLGEALSLVKGQGVVASLVHTLVYELLTILLALFNESTIGRSFSTVTHLTATVLKFPNITADFWKRGLDTGCGVIVTSAVDRFPHEFHPLMEVMTSLAGAGPDSCHKVVSLIQRLPTFSEVLDSSTAHDIQPGDEDNVWILQRRRILYNTDTLSLPAMTIGTVLPERGLNVVRWESPINGWQLFLRHIDILIQQATLGPDHVSIDSTEKVKDIYRLVFQIWDSNPGLASKLQHITDMAYSLLERLCQLPSPDVELVSLCLDVATYQIQHGGTIPAVWSKLATTGLLPFTLSHKHNSEVNAGVVGQLLQSQECINGVFPLTSSLLKLLLESVQRYSPEIKEAILASLLYVQLNVFPVCHRWRYDRSEDRESISQGCLQVFHLVLDNYKDPSSKVLQQLCMNHLLVGDGSKVLQRILRSVDATNDLHGWEFSQETVRTVQMALSVLHRLMRLHQSEPGSPSLVQADLVTLVAHHAHYQHDVRVSTLAVLLLNRFAKEEGILLLACLGPLAEPLRNSFLQRLESPCENVHMKTAVLEFLTVCVDRQPGVIEMFLSAPHTSDQEELVKSCPRDCLKIVLQIFADKKQGEAQLFTAAAEFLQAVWKSRRVTIIRSCREHPNFWPDLLAPLRTTDEPCDVRLCSYLLRIVAMETHYQSVACGTSDFGFKDVVKRISYTLAHWSKFVHHTCSEQTSAQDTSSSRDQTSLLSSWKELILVLAADASSVIRPEQKDPIICDILANLLRFSEEPRNPRLMILSELLLAIISVWQIEVSESKLESLGRLLTSVCMEDDHAHVRTLLALLAAVIRVIQAVPPAKLQFYRPQLTSFIPPICVLLRGCLVDQERLLSSDQFLLLPVVCVSVLRHLVTAVNEPVQWLPLLQQHATLPAMLSVMTSCLQSCRGRLLVTSILSLFVTLATYQQVAENLSLCGLMNQLCLPLSNLQNTKLPGWRSVFTDSLTLTTVMLQSMKHFFLESALDFTGVHVERILLTLLEVRVNFLQSDFDETISTLNFLNELVKYRTMWRIQHPSSYRSTLNGVCCVLQTTVAYLLRPVLVLRILEQQALAAGSTAANKRIRRLSSTEEVERPTPELVQAQTKLLQMLALCLCILRKLSPDLCQLLSHQGLDCESWEPLVQTNFGTPAPDQDVPISFGTLIAAVNVSLRLLTKGDRAPSPAKLTSPESSLPYDRQKLVFILENSVTVLLSQAVLSMRVTSLSSRDKQQLARELGAELDLFVQSITRYVRRALTSPVSGLSAANQSQSLSDQPFIKLLCVVVNKLFK